MIYTLLINYCVIKEINSSKTTAMMTFSKKSFFYFILPILCFSSFASLAQTSPADHVDPIIGTKGWMLFGRTTPFVTPPFGMTHWTSHTLNSKTGNPLYKYNNKYIVGFRGSHKPALWMSDYGFIEMMPGIGQIKTAPEGRKLKFSHKDEVSKPYYYSVNLKEERGNKIKVEFTATIRCGVLKFTFPKDEKPHLIIEASKHPDFNGWIKIDTLNGEITGYNADRYGADLGPTLPNFKGYFVIRFRGKPVNCGTWANAELFNGKLEHSGKQMGAWLAFSGNETEILVKTGTSFISIEQAKENLDKEISTWDFENSKSETKAAWDRHLNRIKIENVSKKEAAIFYTAMYHSSLFPRIFSEYGRYYSAFDDKIHNGVSYNDYSLWDTFRAEHPLLQLIAPEHIDGMVQSLIQMYQEGGWMPKWPNPTYSNIMIGTHADAVVADAVVKGFKGFDLKDAYKAVWKDAMVPPDGDSLKDWTNRAPWSGFEARAGLTWYKKIGYVPVDKTQESVSNTLEGAYDDFCVAKVAKAIGNMRDYDFFLQRSKNYKNLYNPKTGFMAPKKLNGEWNKKQRAGFTEGGPWTYTFCVMQDIPGMIEMMGGTEKFNKKLDKNFRGLRHFHQNEPGHHYPYLYNYSGQSWKTQKHVAKIRSHHYGSKPHGLHGDDDCGQMSAWYIFSALGFYPVCPGTDIFAVGTPQFSKSEIYVDSKNKTKKFEIIAKNVSRKNIYVQAAYLNGTLLTEPFLHYQDIVNGGTLLFEMGKEARAWNEKNVDKK